MKRRVSCFAMGLGLSLLSATSTAGAPTVELRIENHVFVPDVVEIPAATKVRLMVINADSTPEEFESYELNREKVIAGGHKAVIFVGPLEPGDYPFFGEFNPKTAQGVVRVTAAKNL